MYPLMLSVAACLCLAFAGTGFAKTKHSAPKAAAVAAKKVCRQAGRRQGFAVAVGETARGQAVGTAAVRAARYGGFTMAPPPPPPSLDTTSPARSAW